MRKYIVGTIFGVLLTFSISANAEEIKSLIGRAVEGQFVVKLNDKALDNQAIVIDGTSYLPVRAIGEALNLEVGFNADLGITLKNKPSQVTGSVSTMQEPVTTKEIDIEIAAKKMEQKGVMNNLELAKMRLKENPGNEAFSKRIDELAAQIADYDRQIAELEANKAQLGTP